MESMDWGALGFGYFKTDFNVRSTYRDGRWSELEVTDSEVIPLHMAATCLHYGQEAFEGLKVFRGEDGRARVFRIEENARRMINSARCLCMAEPPVELFVEACMKAVRLNEKFIPPYESGASLYIRPLLIGISGSVGVKPSDEYMLVVFVMPVGPYFKSGFKPIKVAIDHDHDRAAPKGTGHVKVGGNYAASILSGETAHEKGFSNVLYLDAQTHQYIDECGAANFFGIKDGSYVTPDSHSVLPSITNKSLCQIAEDLGLRVERRPVPLTELATFDEVGACGTAAVISPIGTIYDLSTGEKMVYGGGIEPGPWSVKLYNRLRDIQYGKVEDTHNWCTLV